MTRLEQSQLKNVKRDYWPFSRIINGGDLEEIILDADGETNKSSL